MLTLYDAANELAPMLDAGIDPETGEMSEELGAAMTQFEGKGLAVVAYILNCEANAKMIRNAASDMSKRAEPYERKAERLKQYLAFNMKRTGTTAISATDGSFEAKLLPERDSAVEILDAAQIPAAYLTDPKPPVAAPDKRLIAKAIKDGFDVPGARIVKKGRLEIK